MGERIAGARGANLGETLKSMSVALRGWREADPMGELVAQMD